MPAKVFFSFKLDGRKSSVLATFAYYKTHYKIQIKMGRGDKRTKKGKITLGSFGKSRTARTRKAAAKAEKKA
jgi:30S ribosomal protein S31